MISSDDPNLESSSRAYQYESLSLSNTNTTASQPSSSLSQPVPRQVRQREYYVSSICLVFLVPALGGALFGYDIGATSFAVTQLQDPDTSGVSWHDSVKKSAVLRGAVVSAVSVGALLGSFAVFVRPDRIGRRTELLIGAGFYLLGAALESSAALLSSSSSSGASVGVAALLIGRVVYGVGVGVTMHGAPTYIAEQSPSHVRGLLVSLKEASIVSGILAGYAIGYALETTTGGWTIAYALSVAPALVVLALGSRVPESCRWLLLRGREADALASLEYVYEEDAARREFETLRRERRELLEATAASSATTTSLRHPSRRAPLVAGLGLVVLQQITGQPSVLSYSATIFRDAGLSDASSVMVGGWKLLLTLCSAVLVDKYGRRRLLFVGCASMGIALVTLAAVFGQGSSSPFAAGMVLAAMFLYIGGYQVGFGPITWLIISEVFPLSVRGEAVALSVQFNFLLNAVVQFVVPVLSDFVGLNVTFAGFAALTFYSIYFVSTNLPETKGLTLEAIEQRFARMHASRTTTTAGSAALSSSEVV